MSAHEPLHVTIDALAPVAGLRCVSSVVLLISLQSRRQHLWQLAQKLINLGPEGFCLFPALLLPFADVSA